ncbi:MAG: 4-hydroxy-tetrahydrodipicolinate synthase [Armatimonadaceae bacterium]
MPDDNTLLPQSPVRGKDAPFGHVITAMVTPFDSEGQVQLTRAVEVAQWLLQNGSDGVVVNGTTGESPTTGIEEKIALVAALVEALGSDKVIAGAGGNNTAEVIELAQRSEAAGAGALLSVAPYYNKPSQEGLYRHFRAVAESVNIPVILYNVPGRTVANIEAATTARLAADVPNIVGTKEASANMAQVGDIARMTPPTFHIYSGDDATILPTLAMGGAGVISVISHIVGPDLAAMHRAWFEGRQSDALKLFLLTLPVTRALFSAPSPAPVKYAMRLKGHEVGGVRLPLVDLTHGEQEVVRLAIEEYDAHHASA